MVLYPNPNKKNVSGAPKWSILGPGLFLILISDIDEEVSESIVSSFAHDNRIGYPIGDFDDIGKLTSIQFSNGPVKTT